MTPMTHSILAAIAILAAIRIGLALFWAGAIYLFDREPERALHPGWHLESKSRLTCWLIAFVATYLFVGLALPDPYRQLFIAAWALLIGRVVLQERRQNLHPRPPSYQLQLRYQTPRPGISTQ